MADTESSHDPDLIQALAGGIPTGEQLLAAIAAGLVRTADFGAPTWWLTREGQAALGATR